MGMPTDFANLAASKSWHISSPKIAQLRFCKDIDSELFKTIFYRKLRQNKRAGPKRTAPTVPQGGV